MEECMNSLREHASSRHSFGSDHSIIFSIFSAVRLGTGADGSENYRAVLASLAIK